MKLLEFTENSALTAIYPNRGAFGGLTYVTYGLCGEIGEVIEILKKILRDDGGSFSDEKIARLKSEVGDVFWYWSQLLFESNTNVGMDVDVDDVQETVFKNFCKTNPGDFKDGDLLFVQGRLIGHCFTSGGQILTVLNTIMDSGEIEESLPKISRMNTEIFKTLCVFLSFLKIKVSEVMQMNLDKLSARKDAGCITGSGETLDER